MTALSWLQALLQVLGVTIGATVAIFGTMGLAAKFPKQANAVIAWIGVWVLVICFIPRSWSDKPFAVWVSIGVASLIRSRYGRQAAHWTARGWEAFLSTKAGGFFKGASSAVWELLRLTGSGLGVLLEALEGPVVGLLSLALWLLGLVLVIWLIKTIWYAV